MLTFGSACNACGALDALFRYCDARGCVPGLNEVYEETSRAIGQAPNPHLHRKCVRCGYEWLERCYALPGNAGGAT